MRKVSMTARDELVNALARRYAIGSRQEKTRVLDEFVAITGFHRKHAMRLLRSGPSVRDSAPRHSRRIYNDAVREALVVLWEASDRICGKRLKALIPTLIEAMERHGHLQLGADVRAGLVAMSAATIDRSLRTVREQAGGRVYDPRLGRFLSPDPVVGDPGSSQSWHAYSYVGNIPMSFTDPTGLIRAPMPWERDMCSQVSGCLNLSGGGGGGGFGTGTALVRGSLSYMHWGVATFFFPSWSWGFDGAEGYNVVSIAFFISGTVPTLTEVAVPAVKRPGDRPIQIEFDDVVGTVVDFIPIVGDAKAFYEAYKDPTPINVTAAVIVVFGPVGDAAGKALKAAHAVYKSQRAAKNPLARGRVAEQRVPNDLGLPKNTPKVRTGEGASTPGSLTKLQSIEIKDCISVSCTRQIRTYTEAARNSGRESVLITGQRTNVNQIATDAFDLIIRRPDLGPQ